MTFENTIWLGLTPLLSLAAAALVALGLRQRTQLLGRFAAARLLHNLTEKASIKRTLIKGGCLVAAVAAIGLALARPQYGVEWSQQKARGLDIVFALDSSKSMLATDLRPTRLDRAKLAIIDLMERLESDRIGLVAFAGQAFLQTPPTLDYAAFRESLEATDPTILSRGGSDIGRALEEAAKAFPTKNNVKVVVLLTDGEDLGGRAIQAAERAADEGIQVFTIGIGTPEGEYLKVRNAEGIEEFVRNAEGQPVRSQLDENTLQQIARITGGSYSRLSGSSLDALYDSVFATLPREERESELKEVRIERFQWLLGTAVLLLVLEILIRRRSPGAAPASALIVLTLFSGVADTGMTSRNGNTASAQVQSASLLPDWSGWHATLPLATAAASTQADSARLAQEAMQAGDYPTALRHYEAAIVEEENRSAQRDALYNMGHAQHQIGRQTYQNGDVAAALEAIKTAQSYFESALEIDPNDEAIREDLEKIGKVREAVEEVIEQQEQQEQEAQDPSSDQSQQSDDQQRQDSSSAGEKGEQNQAEQQESEEGKEQQQSDEGQDGSSSGQQKSAQQPDGSPQSAGESPADAANQEERNARQPGDGEQGQPRERPTGAGEEEESASAGEKEETQTSAPEKNEESGEAGAQAVPEVSETEQSGAKNGRTASRGGQAVRVEGMSLEEARDLLDSLQGKEEILPFTQPLPGRGRPLQDW